MGQIRLILVGGFLGAGKTTLISRAARLLMDQGLRVGLITNDQAPNLADTGLLRRQGFAVDEVDGGCFCCHFDALVSAWERIINEHNPQVIFGEPVGSCTDLSATVAQPIKKFFADLFTLAPVSVLSDPYRLREFLAREGRGGFPENVVYIFGKQLEEADLIVLNKADLLSPPEMDRLLEALGERFPGKPVLTMSALKGEGVAAWLEFLFQEEASGRYLAEVDYEVYAEGEAALGWLNASLTLQADKNPDWRAFVLDFLERVQGESQGLGAEIAHLKVLLTARDGSLQANLTSSAGQPFVQVEGDLGAEGLGQADLVVNARGHLDPEQLRGMVSRGLEQAAGERITVKVATLESFRPGRPEPTHHFEAVV